jgi:predicted metal-dependent hydrolase
MPRKSFRYGDDRIEYDVLFMPAKRNKVAIHVHGDGEVHVDAPMGQDLATVHGAVLRRARWIKRHVDEARRQRAQAMPRNYKSGESLLYLGRRYQLKVKRLNGQAPSVKLTRGQICVEVPSAEPDLIRERLAAWYRRRAADTFERRLTEIADRVVWLKTIPVWRIVRMQKQWGSCSPAGVILLNPHLVKAPRVCVDYVICHELCHLQEHNHGLHYYRLLEQVMPDWETVKARLDGMAELLLNE